MESVSLVNAVEGKIANENRILKSIRRDALGVTNFAKTVGHLQFLDKFNFFRLTKEEMAGGIFDNSLSLI